MNDDGHLEQIIQHGYTVIESLVPDDIVSSFRSIAEHERLPRDLYIFGTDLFCTHPELVLPIVTAPRSLDIAERIVGPFVQLDSFSIVGIAAGCLADISWHRDPYGSVPRGNDFHAPMAMNLLIYLQDLTDENGPLRVIPGSHRTELTMDSTERSKPHRSEQLVYARAGDGVLIHNNLVHSRTRNKSSLDRLHISVVFSLSCMRPTVDFRLPEMVEIIGPVRSSGNRRLLRLFGENSSAVERYNSGFMQPDELMWKQWLSEDRLQT